MIDTVCCMLAVWQGGTNNVDILLKRVFCARAALTGVPAPASMASDIRSFKANKCVTSPVTILHIVLDRPPHPTGPMWRSSDGGWYSDIPPSTPCQQTMPMSKFALFRADYPSTLVKHPRARLVNVTPSKAGGLHMEICSRGRSMYLYFSQIGSQQQRGHEGGHVLILIETVMLQTG